MIDGSNSVYFFYDEIWLVVGYLTWRIKSCPFIEIFIKQSEQKLETSCFLARVFTQFLQQRVKG